jgi:hypothetical protein
MVYVFYRRLVAIVFFRIGFGRRMAEDIRGPGLFTNGKGGIGILPVFSG